MTPIQNRIARYHYQDRVQNLYTTVVGTFLLGIVLLMPDFNAIFQNSRALICLTTAAIFFTFIKIYNWRVLVTNFLLVGFYLALLAFEFFQLGFPGSPVNYDWSSYEVSKGVMFDIFVAALPSIYIGIRLLLVIPLLMMLKEFKLSST